MPSELLSIFLLSSPWREQPCRWSPGQGSWDQRMLQPWGQRMLQPWHHCAQHRLLSCRALSDSRKHVKSSSHAGNEKGDKKSQVEWRCFSPTTDSLEAEKLTSISSILMLMGRRAVAWLGDCQCFVIPALQFQNRWWESRIGARSWVRSEGHKACRAWSKGPGRPFPIPAHTHYGRAATDKDILVWAANFKESWVLNTNASPLCHCLQPWHSYNNADNNLIMLRNPPDQGTDTFLASFSEMHFCMFLLPPGWFLPFPNLTLYNSPKSIGFPLHISEAIFWLEEGGFSYKHFMYLFF